MKTLQLLEKMKQYPIFTPSLLKADNNSYANLYLHRLNKKKLIERIEKNIYTLYKDPFLVASKITWPSYISCWSSLKFHNLTEQVPHAIFVIAPNYKKTVIYQNTPIVFITTSSKNIFGYEKINYKGFEIFIADKEKSIIDCALLKKASFSELKEIVEGHIKEIDSKKFIRYLKIINNKSLIKRFGYLLDSLGKDFYPSLKKSIGKTYICLDYTKKKTSRKNEKWRIIENA